MTNSVYQETILHHNKHPKNFGKPDKPCCTLEGQNQMCGDYISLYLTFEKENTLVQNITFEGVGCAILKASASMMTEILKEKSVFEIHELAHEFKKILNGELEYSPKLGELNIFSGLSSFQSRTKCALLAWETLLKGIKDPCPECR